MLADGWTIVTSGCGPLVGVAVAVGGDVGVGSGIVGVGGANVGAIVKVGGITVAVGGMGLGVAVALAVGLAVAVAVGSCVGVRVAVGALLSSTVVVSVRTMDVVVGSGDGSFLQAARTSASSETVTTRLCRLTMSFLHDCVPH